MVGFAARGFFYLATFQHTNWAISQPILLIDSY